MLQPRSDNAIPLLQLLVLPQSQTSPFKPGKHVTRMAKPCRDAFACELAEELAIISEVGGVFATNLHTNPGGLALADIPIVQQVCNLLLSTATNAE